MAVRVPFVPSFFCFGCLRPLNLLCIKLYCVRVYLLGAPVPLLSVVLAPRKALLALMGPEVPVSPMGDSPPYSNENTDCSDAPVCWGPALIRRKVALDLFRFAACKRFSVLRHCVLLSDASEFKDAVPFASCLFGPRLPHIFFLLGSFRLFHACPLSASFSVEALHFVVCLAVFCPISPLYVSFSFCKRTKSSAICDLSRGGLLSLIA
jgi:hypothetical protein